MTLPWLPTLKQTFLLRVRAAAGGGGGGKLQQHLYRQFLFRSKCGLNLLSSPPNLEHEVCWGGEGRAAMLLKLGCEQRLGGGPCPARTRSNVVSHRQSKTGKLLSSINIGGTRD